MTVENNTEKNGVEPEIVQSTEPVVEKTEKKDIPDVTKVFTEEEVTKLITEKVQEAQRTAFKTAKDQLNSEIAGLKEKIAKMEKPSPDNTTKEELEKLQGKLAETSKKLSVMENEGAKAMSEVENLKQQLQQSALDKRRAEIIAEARGEIIPELVIGNSEEELIAAAKKATEQYYEIDRAIREKLKLPTRDEEQKQTAKASEPVEVSRINTRDRNQVKDWQDKRQEIIANVYSKYGLTIE